MSMPLALMCSIRIVRLMRSTYLRKREEEEQEKHFINRNFLSALDTLSIDK